MTRRVVAFVCCVGIGSAASTVDACMGVSATLYHTVQGGFIIPERGRALAGPRITFWQFGQYALFNSGTQEQWQSDGSEPWLVHVMSQYQANGISTAVDPDLYRLSQADWAGPNIVGCPYDLAHEQRRTVVELTMNQNSGSPEHYSVYLIASVRFDVGSSSFNFDNVADGNGGRPADVRTQPIPVPQIAGAAIENQKNPRYMNVPLTIPAAKSFGDAGAPNLIYGYNIYYMNDQAPISNFPPDYQPVRDAGNPEQQLATVPYGSTVVMVAVPKPTAGSYFVTQLVYADTTAVLVSAGVSGNSQMVPVFNSAPGDKPDASETPSGPAEGRDEPTAKADRPAESGDAKPKRDGAAPGKPQDSARERSTPVAAKATPVSDSAAEASGSAVANANVGGPTRNEVGGGVVGGTPGADTRRVESGRRESERGQEPTGTDRGRPANDGVKSDGPSTDRAVVTRPESGGTPPLASERPGPAPMAELAGGPSESVPREIAGGLTEGTPGKRRDGEVTGSGSGGSGVQSASGVESSLHDAAKALDGAQAQLADNVTVVATTEPGQDAGSNQGAADDRSRSAWWYLDAAFLAALSALALLVLRGRGLVG